MFPWQPLLVVFVVALFVRVAVGVEVWDLPIVRTPKLDSAEYVSWARRLAAGDFGWPVVSPHGPGYPVFLAALFVIGSGSLHVTLLAQAIVGALTAALIVAIGREWFGPRAGLLGGIVYAVYGPAAYIDTALLSEGLLLFLLTLAVFLMCREPLTMTRVAAAGAALGAATLVRPTAILIAAASVAWLLVCERRQQLRAVAMAGVLALVCVLVVSPALARSWWGSHVFGLQGYGGMNFYIGNSPLHTGRATFRLGGGWDALNAEASRAGIADPAAQDRYYVTKTFAEIREHPGAFVKLLASKSLWLVQAEEPRDSHSYYFFTDRSLVLRVLPRMAILFSLACVGALAIARRRKRASLLLFVALAAASGIVLLVVGMRYRMPLVPMLAIAAGAGLDATIDGVVTRRKRELALFAATAAGAIVLSHVLSDPRHRNIAEEWAFTGNALVTERNLADAETAYRRAVALDPGCGLAWDGLGVVHYNSGRLSDARQDFSRALALDPENAQALFHLALVDERERHIASAAAGYKRALDLSPYDVDIARRLGAVLLADNRPADAVPYLRMAVKLAPADADAHHALATALGMARQLAEAHAEMRRVVELAPSNGEAWLDLCLLSLDLHDIGAASAALQRARELGAGAERLAFASTALARATKE